MWGTLAEYCKILYYLLNFLPMATTTGTQTEKTSPLIERMFEAGAHYGYSRSKRHPSAKPHLFGIKNRVDIIDLERTGSALARAEEFARELGISHRH